MLRGLLLRLALPQRLLVGGLLLQRRETVVDLAELLVLLAGLRDQLLERGHLIVRRRRQGGGRGRRCLGRADARGVGARRARSALRLRGRVAFGQPEQRARRPRRAGAGWGGVAGPGAPCGPAVNAGSLPRGGS